MFEKLGYCLFVLSLASCGGNSNPGDDNNALLPDAGLSVDAGETSSPQITIGNVIEKSAEAVCDIMTRCCDLESQQAYFSRWKDAEFLGDWVAQMPGEEALSYESCLTLMRGIYPDMWLGSWSERVAQGEVVFNGAEAESCIDELNRAECGLESQRVLFDPSCFGNSAPFGAKEQRRIFNRTQGEGKSCGAIRDGFGGLYYGSCAPNIAFCCIPDELQAENCSPFPALNKVGICRRASQEGESCNERPLQLCATGLYCDVDNYTCQKENWAPIASGEPCMEGIDYLGECIDSYCSLESKKCETFVEVGGGCAYGFECESSYCDQNTLTCSDNPLCNPA